MADEQKKTYDLDDDDRPREPDRPPTPTPTPTPASPPDAPHRRGDPCPNCGAPMTGSDSLVCLRCGFDLKTLEVHDTEQSEEVIADEPEEEARVVSPGGRGNQWLPVALAAGSAVVLLVGYLAGAGGLFPALTAVSGEGGPPAELTVGFAERFTEIGRFLVLVAVLVGCGLLGLLALATLWNAGFGDVRLAVLRVAAIVITMRLAAFLDFGRRSAEWTAEIILQAAIFVGLTMLLLRLGPRDAALYGLLTMFALAGLWVLGELVGWVLLRGRD